MLVITHYQRLLDHIVPDHVHVLAHGRIVKSGTRNSRLSLSRTVMRNSPRKRRKCYEFDYSHQPSSA